jgi:hypothetical protein
LNSTVRRACKYERDSALPDVLHGTRKLRRDRDASPTFSTIVGMLPDPPAVHADFTRHAT